jgi:hypothetical protein
MLPVTHASNGARLDESLPAPRAQLEGEGSEGAGLDAGSFEVESLACESFEVESPVDPLDVDSLDEVDSFPGVPDDPLASDLRESVL